MILDEKNKLIDLAKAIFKQFNVSTTSEIEVSKEGTVMVNMLSLRMTFYYILFLKFKTVLSENYPNIKVPLKLRNHLISLHDVKKQDGFKKIIRGFTRYLITDEEKYAQSYSAEELISQHTEFQAFSGKVI
jgi:hypothetical protein